VSATPATRTAIRLRARRKTLPREVARTIVAGRDKRLEEAVRSLLDRFPEAEVDEALWPAIKLAYAGLVREHGRPERAHAFFNSIACQVLPRRHHHDEFIFERRRHRRG
jgi:isocitrate dehydrogenase kinase/phosphatase